MIDINESEVTALIRQMAKSLLIDICKYSFESLCDVVDMSLVVVYDMIGLLQIFEEVSYL